MRIEEPAGASPRSTHGRIDDIEVLRAFAVGMVLVQHLSWDLIPWQAPNAGPVFGRFGFWSGVDLFFAISGFVIARSFLPQLAGAASRKAFFQITLSFWVRRVWRLLPTAWLWLVVMLALVVGFNRTGAFGSLEANVRGGLAALFYVENLQLYQAMRTGHAGVTAIYWTLSLEEQFYILLPFIAFLSGRRLPLVIALIAAGQLFLDRTTSPAHLLPNLIRSDGLALGVLLAIWSGRPSYLRLEPAWLARKPWPVLIAPLFLLVFTIATGEWLGLGRSKMAVVTLLSVGAVWLASYDRDLILLQGRLKQALCWIGARSYAIYLIHLPIFHATVEFWSRTRPEMLEPSTAHLVILLAGALSLTCALAELNYRYVEVPLRRRGVGIASSILSRSRDAGAAVVQSAA